MKAKYKKISVVCRADKDVPEEEVKEKMAEAFARRLVREIELFKMPVPYDMIEYQGLLRIKVVHHD